MGPVFRVFSYLRRYPRLAAALLLCALVGTSLVVAPAKILQLIIDEVIGAGREELFIPLIAAAAGLYFARELLDCLRINLNNVFEQKIIFDIRRDLYHKIQRLPLRWFDKNHSGDVMTRVSGDVTAMERILIDGIEQGVIAVFQIIMVVIMMYLADPKLALLALAPIPIKALGAWVYSRGARERNRSVRKATSDLNSLVVDNVSGIRQIKAYATEEEEEERFSKASQKVRDASLRVMRMWSIYKPGMTFLNGLGWVLIVGFGGAAAIRGDLKPGELVLFATLANQLYNPIMRLHGLNQMAQASAAAAERVFEILDDQDEPGLGKGKVIDPATVEGGIVFESVGFAYPGGGGEAVRDIDLTVLPGQSVALVGPTGAGKSTLIDLLTRFYEYDLGEIRVDGTPVKDINKASLRDSIGYVTQESFLFNGTLRDNLLFARRDATDDELWEALRAANAETFASKLSDGLDTEVGERGVKLSVGEKQRVSIARALLKNPPILLLDEATASVDTQTERLIQDALDHLLESRTSIVIAHRLSTVRKADRIYVIDGGRVVEEGTHFELSYADGLYAELVRSSLLDVD